MSKLSLIRTTLGIIVNQNVDVDQLIHEAHRLGAKVVVYANSNNQTIRDADIKIIGQLNNKAKLKEFATQCQLVVYVNGSGISEAMVSYLRQFTNVPQGSASLDISNDRSIQRVFLDTLQIQSLPYDTVFNLSDVKKALNTLHSPLLLRPVQTSYVQQRDVIITSLEQLASLKPMFNGEAYLVESLPAHARYFQLTVVKSTRDVVAMPVLENHYKGQKLDFVNEKPDVSSKIIGQLKQRAMTIVNHINYVGALTITFILINDNEVYVDGIDSSFNFANNIYNLTSNNFYQMFLRAVVGLPIHFQADHRAWLIKAVTRNNSSQLSKLWNDDESIKFNLSSLINDAIQTGYVLISASSIADAIRKLHKDQL